MISMLLYSKAHSSTHHQPLQRHTDDGPWSPKLEKMLGLHTKYREGGWDHWWPPSLCTVLVFLWVAVCMDTSCLCTMVYNFSLTKGLQVSNVKLMSLFFTYTDVHTKYIVNKGKLIDILEYVHVNEFFLICFFELRSLRVTYWKVFLQKLKHVSFLS